MNQGLTAAAGLVLLAPAAAGLAALPPEPQGQEARGLAFVAFRIPVRTEAEALEVSAVGDPVGDAGLAPPDGRPRDRLPLAADPTLAIPDGANATWRGYEDVHHVVLRLQAPNVDGSVTREVLLSADGARLRVPLHLEVDPRRPTAEVEGNRVSLDVPHARTLGGAHLRGPDQAWAAAPTEEGFEVPLEDVPTGIPLTPTVTLRNGTTVAGDPVTVPEPPTPPAADDPDTARDQPRNDTLAPNETASEPDPTPSKGGDPGPAAPARVDDDGHLLTAAPVALAALAAAARATL